MVKHTQTIRRQIAEELFECVWPFCGVGAERDKVSSPFIIMLLTSSEKKSCTIEGNTLHEYVKAVCPYERASES